MEQAQTLTLQNTWVLVWSAPGLQGMVSILNTPDHLSKHLCLECLSGCLLPSVKVLTFVYSLKCLIKEIQTLLLSLAHSPPKSSSVLEVGMSLLSFINASTLNHS